jgi:hypothetical protein
MLFFKIFILYIYIYITPLETKKTKGLNEKNSMHQQTQAASTHPGG